MFFKFAAPKDIYAHEAAAHKAAACEVASMNAVVRADVRLNVCLSALLLWRGYCVTATAFAPVSSATLAVGSEDAGRTVHNGAKSFMAKRRAAALGAALRLQEHAVVGGAKVALAIDVEVHLATDGRLYIIDCGARAAAAVRPAARLIAMGRQGG